MNFNSSHDQLYSHHSFLPNPACHFFFDPTPQDHTAFYDHHQLYRPSDHVPDDQNYGGSTSEMKSKVDGGLKLGVWRNDEDDEHQSKSNPIKWMSSKMRVMQKMKHSDHGKMTSSADHKAAVQKPPSLSVDADSSSYASSYSNSPIRVCSDCNTTKTPLWRSGPKGPKSLCNACGIRQRKARRAMAAAAAATNGVTANASDQSAGKMKLQHKGKLAKNGHASHPQSQLKKRCKTAEGSPSAGEKQLGFEDFLINLSNNLAFHRVFPEEEKDAAILLMALSSGLVNG